MSTSSATASNEITITIGASWTRPEINHQMLERIDAARKMGMRALIGPRLIGFGPGDLGFGEDFYAQHPADEAFISAVETTSSLDAAILRCGLGRARAINLAQRFSERAGVEGEFWPQGLERAMSDKERKEVSIAVSEWADGEAVAAHAGYANDFFCTHDNGGILGNQSILHSSHRNWLLEKYNVRFVTINELAGCLTPKYDFGTERLR